MANTEFARETERRLPPIHKVERSASVRHASTATKGLKMAHVSNFRVAL